VQGGRHALSTTHDRYAVVNADGPPVVVIWRKCDNAAPIGVALADPLAGAWQVANPHLVRTQALGLAGGLAGAAMENAAMVGEVNKK